MSIIVAESLPKEYYEWLEELQALDFALVELTLYLDTHPNDVATIEQFNDLSYQRRLQQQKNRKEIWPSSAIWK